ncbi:MAG: thioredoxin, partial [Pirellulaceae bacterium]
MKSRRSGWWIAMLLGSSSYALAADPDPQLVKALAQAPKQKGVEPESFPADQCQGSLQKRAGVEGYLVLGPDRQVLRWFADTNGDRNVDLWSYFSGGIEIYRDIDSDFNGKVDQFRWLGTQGTRWGVDRNEDGALDQWKAISAE